MGKRIAWNQTFGRWAPSGAAVLVSDPLEIDAVIRLLDFWVLKEKGLSFFTGTPVDSADQLRRDGFVAFGTTLDPYKFIAEAADQVRSHRQLWYTHLDMKSCRTIETAFKAPNSDDLRYLKIQFVTKGKRWFDPATVREIFVNYHPATLIPKPKAVYE